MTSARPKSACKLMPHAVSGRFCVSGCFTAQLYLHFMSSCTLVCAGSDHKLPQGRVTPSALPVLPALYTGYACPTCLLSIADALQSDQSRCPDLADEFVHPHTEWMLKQPLATYVLDPQPVYLKHAKPTASGGLAAASGSPSGPSNDASGPALEADTATQRDPSPEATLTPRLAHAASAATADQAQSHVPYAAGALDQQHGIEQGQAISKQATPALSGFSASQPSDLPAGGNPNTPAGKLCLVSTTSDGHCMLTELPAMFHAQQGCHPYSGTANISSLLYISIVLALRAKMQIAQHRCRVGVITPPGKAGQSAVKVLHIAHTYAGFQTF